MVELGMGPPEAFIFGVILIANEDLGDEKRAFLGS
jgi:hypothetical protein